MSNENKQHDERAAWKSVRVNAAEFDALMDALQRAEDKGYLPDAMQAEWTAFQFYDASRDASVSATKAATEDEPLAWRVEWVRGDHTWVRTYTNERDAVDDGQSFNGTVTPLFARATQQATTGDERAERYRKALYQIAYWPCGGGADGQSKIEEYALSVLDGDPPVGELDPHDALRYMACRTSAIERGLFATPEEYDAMVDDSLRKKGKEVLTGRGNNYGKKVAKDGSLYRATTPSPVAGSAGQAPDGNFIQIDRRDFFDFVRGAIRSALSDGSCEGADDGEPKAAADCWSEAHSRTETLFDKLAITAPSLATDAGAVLTDEQIAEALTIPGLNLEASLELSELPLLYSGVRALLAAARKAEIERSGGAQ